MDFGHGGDKKKQKKKAGVWRLTRATQFDILQGIVPRFKSQQAGQGSQPLPYASTVVQLTQGGSASAVTLGFFATSCQLFRSLAARRNFLLRPPHPLCTPFSAGTTRRKHVLCCRAAACVSVGILRVGRSEIRGQAGLSLFACV